MVWSHSWEKIKKSGHIHSKLQVEVLDKEKLIIQAGNRPGHFPSLYHTMLSCLNMLVANWVRGHNAEHNFPLRSGGSQHSPLQVTMALLSWDIMLLNTIFSGPHWLLYQSRSSLWLNRTIFKHDVPLPFILLQTFMLMLQQLRRWLTRI